KPASETSTAPRTEQLPTPPETSSRSAPEVPVTVKDVPKETAAQKTPESAPEAPSPAAATKGTPVAGTTNIPLPQDQPAQQARNTPDAPLSAATDAPQPTPPVSDTPPPDQPQPLPLADNQANAPATDAASLPPEPAHHH